MTQQVSEFCQQHNLTVEQLAEKSGLDLTRVQAIFMGRWTPSPKERKRIADVFGVTVDDITWGHKTPIQHIYGHGPN